MKKSKILLSGLLLGALSFSPVALSAYSCSEGSVAPYGGYSSSNDGYYSNGYYAAPDQGYSRGAVLENRGYGYFNNDRDSDRDNDRDWGRDRDNDNRDWGRDRDNDNEENMPVIRDRNFNNNNS